MCEKGSCRLVGARRLATARSLPFPRNLMRDLPDQPSRCSGWFRSMVRPRCSMVGLAATRGIGNLDHSQASEASNRERALLRGVLTEALEAERRKKMSLEKQLAQTMPPAPHMDQGTQENDEAVKTYEKAIRRSQQVPQRLAEVDAASTRLAKMLVQAEDLSVDLALLRQDVESLGLSSRLQTFDVEATLLRQWGRPDGFDGLAVKSPRGVPILVARQRFSDGLLRRIARGKDLWFQVRDTCGSRVLLRTSMVRGLTCSPREDMEMAADLAAFFSDWRHSQDVEVMFTDSRHVAKRGGRVGQMKDSKKLGVIRARPARVAGLARKTKEEQGWLESL
eukprot:gnl/TRDRNA2_/TRDRNA2_128050_c0_seq2.p1 gnl/TRDRNA2_/TRDRNA2_128050_c0~~gnl/TRDRNA2_/TRDRNA2_128050_c0_seq2.p1  ORF type:complete len:336 (-),score=43.07 gnl/TRDRNA2_/TRDRNA2_128050_c0_seq2:81-1088(-)